ncbi:CoA ester lyase [uncultured Sneathiella sp.]|uniref:HpcH/HpaI aldolase/citrate lyase family protein n=1 Tax=uncultured Sneathiella sp. TaxID=879315 RepID=UPI0030EFA248|tara:strand:- start:6882 stop:7763 length:882 start_codon:yes stop_codon:yes gene_type:complete
MLFRSLFFAPANRSDLLTKFPRFSADCYVVDLEDGTPPDDKIKAREALADNIGMLRKAEVKGLVYVRVNEPGSSFYLEDIAAAVKCDIDGIVIPKLETPDQCEPIISAIRKAGKTETSDRPIKIMGGIESMLGVLNVNELCGSNDMMSSVFFGAEDLAADMGARRTEDGDEVLYARSRVVLAAKIAGIVAIDQAVIDVRNDELCRRDASKGRDLGYEGKICVIPRQIDICNAVYAPTEEEVAEASEVVTVYRDAMSRGIGTIDFKGKMIDGPLLKRAEATLAISKIIKNRENA